MRVSVRLEHSNFVTLQPIQEIKVIRKPGKQEKDVFLEHFRQMQQPLVCEKSIRRQGKKRGEGDQGDEEMEKKSVSKLISSLSISPFLHSRHGLLQTAKVLPNFELISRFVLRIWDLAAVHSIDGVFH